MAIKRWGDVDGLICKLETALAKASTKANLDTLIDELPQEYTLAIIESCRWLEWCSNCECLFDGRKGCPRDIAQGPIAAAEEMLRNHADDVRRLSADKWVDVVVQDIADEVADGVELLANRVSVLGEED